MFLDGKNQKSEKAMHGMKKTFAKDVSEKRLIFKICKRFLQFNNNKKQTTQLQNG